jgi:hypothetical protein
MGKQPVVPSQKLLPDTRETDHCRTWAGVIGEEKQENDPIKIIKAIEMFY